MAGEGDPVGERQMRRRWQEYGVVVLVAVVYAVVGLTFAAAANGAPSIRLREAWRLAAWIVCGVAFAAQIGYEHWRLGSGPGRVAVRAALAAGLGALALAAAATVHAQRTGATNLRAFVLALILWPVITAVPAFIGAIVASAVLSKWRRSGTRAALLSS